MGLHRVGSTTSKMTNEHPKGSASILKLVSLSGHVFVQEHCLPMSWQFWKGCLKKILPEPLQQGCSICWWIHTIASFYKHQSWALKPFLNVCFILKTFRAINIIDKYFQILCTSMKCIPYPGGCQKCIPMQPHDSVSYFSSRWIKFNEKVTQGISKRFRRCIRCLMCIPDPAGYKRPSQM